MPTYLETHFQRIAFLPRSRYGRERVVRPPPVPRPVNCLFSIGHVGIQRYLIGQRAVGLLLRHASPSKQWVSEKSGAVDALSEKCLIVLIVFNCNCCLFTNLTLCF